MHYTTGMYCMLKAPDISEFQWHPFTIASGGGQQKFQVLFAIVGDWTTELSKRITDAQKAGGSSPQYPRICVRGGYGAPAEGMGNKKHVVMVGGGVGATPFLSFLSNICNSARTGGKDQFDGVESAVFYWVSREPDDFAWVNEYSSIIAATPSLKNRVSIRLCLTKALDASATEDCSAVEIGMFWVGVQVALTKLSSKELGSELGAPTQFGRPNWQKEFAAHAEELKKKHDASGGDALEISVFACGNQMLVNSLEEACGNMTDVKMQFRCFAEEF
jgi:predicted ferric reductase